MNQLLSLAGLPGVGKSTISMAISKKLEARIVDIDDFKKSDVDPILLKGQIDPPEVRWNYYQKALGYVFGLFDEGTSTVIMDEVFHLNSLRLQVEVLCKGHNVQVLWIEVRCPYDMVEKRLKSIAREGHILSTEETLKMHLMFLEMFEKFPTCTKNHVVVNNDKQVSMDLLVEGILKKL